MRLVGQARIETTKVTMMENLENWLSGTACDSLCCCHQAPKATLRWEITFNFNEDAAVGKILALSCNKIN